MATDLTLVIIGAASTVVTAVASAGINAWLQRKADTARFDLEQLRLKAEADRASEERQMKNDEDRRSAERRRLVEQHERLIEAAAAVIDLCEQFAGYTALSTEAAGKVRTAAARLALGFRYTRAGDVCDAWIKAVRTRGFEASELMPFAQRLSDAAIADAWDFSRDPDVSS